MSSRPSALSLRSGSASRVHLTALGLHCQCSGYIPRIFPGSLTMTLMELQNLLLVVCCFWYHYHVTIPAVTYTHPWVVCLSVCLLAFSSAGNQIQLGSCSSHELRRSPSHTFLNPGQDSLSPYRFPDLAFLCVSWVGTILFALQLCAETWEHACQSSL